ncbi:MAG: methyltransferase domain-containing protein, partial [Alphaproteobacteria bacterium]|nr:methyltransferase domain-containing protein [Alphaproteobacteria bacterium]
MTEATAETIESAIEQRNQLLKEIDAASIHKAWFTLSHLLLDEGAKVVDMGCNDGAVTYAMAAMNPKMKFIGLDKSKRQINKAKEIYQLHNLEYQIGDTVSELFEPESLDAIINSDVLHEVYSASRYNERIVSDTLRRHFKMLKKGGIMFIRDFAQPPEGEFVLLEMPDNPSIGNDLAGLSEADLLVWYSEHARPRQDPGCGGFFLEELPPRFPKTRLFRLPHKWAYEFLMRKDDRRHWETALPVEYTFFTLRDFRRELRNFGARVQYSGPHWEEDLIEKNFEKKNIRLYDDTGALLAPPPTCFIAVAVKLAERKSLNIEERRPSPAANKLQVTALRDQKTGKLADVVSRGMDVSEILPYRIDETGQLKIYLHDGVAKSIVNAVPRSGVNLDQREWSGHMVEAMAVDNLAMADYQPVDTKSTVLFGRDYLGLRPQDGALLEKGPDYYPSPEYIDERIFTWYLKVEKARSVAMAPKNLIGHNDRFQAKGTIREFDAQQILNAITVGMIPNARLELQILCLFQYLGLPAENWTGKRLNLQAGKITENKSLRALLSSSGLEEKRFREIKGTSGQLRPVHSTFVEEAQTQGTIAGLSAQDVDFVIFDDRTVNTAVVLPLKMDLKSEI